MNIREEILKERSKPHIIRIASYACESKNNFKELVRCFVDKDKVIAQRAAWCLSWAVVKDPSMIQPHVKNLVAQLNRKDVHDGVIRSAVQIFERIEIPETFHGEIMNACFGFIEDPSTPIAVKAFSLTTLFNLCKQYPEIGPELKLIIEERWDTETAAFRSRGKKILAALSK